MPSEPAPLTRLRPPAVVVGDEEETDKRSIFVFDDPFERGPHDFRPVSLPSNKGNSNGPKEQMDAERVERITRSLM